MYKCISCDVKKDIGDDVYFVFDGISYIPTCSVECANVAKDKAVQKAQHIIDKIKKQEILKDRW